MEQIAYPKFKFKPRDMQKVEQVIEFLPHIIFPCKSYVHPYSDTVVEHTRQKANSHGHKLLALRKHQLR